MKFTLKSLMAGAAAVALTGGLVVAGAGAASASSSNPSYEPDPSAVGTVSFYDASGNQIGGGSTSSLLAGYYKASGPKVAGFATNKGYVALATPQDAVPTASWSTVEQLGSAQDYTTLQAGYPAGLNNAATNVVVKGAATDENLSAHIANYPSASVTDPGVYQLRLYTSSAATTYYVADVFVSGSTWTQVYPALPAATSTTTTLSASPVSPVILGAGATTLSASVTPASGSLTNGSVQFSDGAAVLGTVAYTGTNPVTLTIPATGAGSFAVGTHSLTATYLPSGIAFSGSTSSAVSYKVNPVQVVPTVGVAVNVGTGVALSPVVVTATVAPAAAAGTVTFSEGANTLGTAPVSGGTATLTVSSFIAGSHTVHAAFAPTDTTTYAAASGDSAAFSLNAPSITPDQQYIKVTVDNGSLTLSSPYDAAHPFDLGHLTLDATGTYLYGQQNFGDATHGNNGLTVTDTRAGNNGWTVSAVATNFSDGTGDSIDAKGFGLTGVTPVYIAPNAIAAGVNPVTPTDVAPNTLAPADSNTGLGASHAIASVVHGDGSVYITGVLKLYAPSSTKAGVYTSVLTFTAA